MGSLIKFLITCLLSQLGTMIGAIVGVFDKEPSNEYIGFIISLSGGIMFSVVSFDLIPSGMEEMKTIGFLMWIIIGILLMFFIDLSLKGEAFEKIAILTAISLSIHNFPEGIIMGVGLGSNTLLGIKMCLTIAIHDIPEGLAVAAPVYAISKKKIKALLFAYATSLSTVIGGIIGYRIVFNKEFLGICYGISSGIMLYVVVFEMIPEGFKLCKVKKTSLGILIGYLLGFIMSLF